MNSDRGKNSGFSLIEILMVLAIIALVAVSAWPSYQNVVIRTGRAEAKSALLAVTSDQERYFSSFNRYVNDASPLDAPAKTGRSRVTASGLYTISVEACVDGRLEFCFVATATPLGAQSADACTSLSIDNAGVRTATGSLAESNECWIH